MHIFIPIFFNIWVTYNDRTVLPNPGNHGEYREMIPFDGRTTQMQLVVGWIFVDRDEIPRSSQKPLIHCPRRSTKYDCRPVCDLADLFGQRIRWGRNLNSFD